MYEDGHEIIPRVPPVFRTRHNCRYLSTLAGFGVSYAYLNTMETTLLRTFVAVSMMLMVESSPNEVTARRPIDIPRAFPLLALRWYRMIHPNSGQRVGARNRLSMTMP
jgi:hypothetical protein